jgi:hypothetical protein
MEWVFNENENRKFGKFFQIWRVEHIFPSLYLLFIYEQWLWKKLNCLF